MKKLLLIVILLISSNYIFAQDDLYLSLEKVEWVRNSNKEVIKISSDLSSYCVMNQASFKFTYIIGDKINVKGIIVKVTKSEIIDGTYFTVNSNNSGQLNVLLDLTNNLFVIKAADFTIYSKINIDKSTLL